MAGKVGRGIYSSRRWQVTRLAAIKRAHYRCEKCERRGKLEVDHKVPIHRGGPPFDIDNLQVLCRQCHIAKTAKERRNSEQCIPGQFEWDAYVRNLLRQNQNPKGVEHEPQAEIRVEIHCR